MIRRSVLTLGALAAAALVSSCSTFDRNDTVASLEGQSLSRSELATLLGGIDDGASARVVIGGWISLVALGGDGSGVKDSKDLTERVKAAQTALVDDHVAEAEAAYSKGLNGAVALCIGAIPVAADTDPQTVIDAVAAGTSWADAATKWSTNANLAKSGGLITDEQGTNCFEPGIYNAGLLKAMGDAGAEPGKPVVVSLGDGSKAVVLIRGFDTLTKDEMAIFAQDQLSADKRSKLAGHQVYVNPQFGRWDEASLAVVPLTQG